eukprot:COSAG02_NODE_54593_length_295_cov_0.790816_1_plen_54_part_10
MVLRSLVLGAVGWQQLLFFALAGILPTDRQSAVGESCKDEPTLEKAMRPPRPSA